MKKFLIISMITAFAVNLIAQSDYDQINRDEIYLVNTDSEKKGIHNPKASEIKTFSTAEELFGKSYKNEKIYREIEDDYYYVLKYDDGFELRVPEDKKLDIGFHIRSNKYSMLLQSGNKIMVGMTIEELGTIFPKSYAKRIIINDIARLKGKTGMIVYFSRRLNNKEIVEDAWISFIFNSETNRLEEFYSWEAK